MFKWTVDVESDWGGRTNDTKGIEEGLPKIIKAFADNGIRALFFVSGELLTTHKELPQILRIYGHEVGSHGYFHTIYKEDFRKERDKDLSFRALGCEKYRAPKFNYITDDPYSNPKNHVGLLKYMWFGGQVTDETIFYLHPFDIVGGSNPPNLFCRLWYSRPDKAYETFLNLINRYH